MTSDGCMAVGADGEPQGLPRVWDPKGTGPPPKGWANTAKFYIREAQKPISIRRKVK